MPDIASAQTRLRANAIVIGQLTQDLSADQMRWKPAAGEWSILEVINHLLDEEREDFRQRLDIALHRPEEPVPPIDPQGWVTARGYNQRDLHTSLQDFLTEREQSLLWLAQLHAPTWGQHIRHPTLGTLTAGDFLLAWQGHDLLHIRQLTELHWQYLHHCYPLAAIQYAGEW
jgi:hypothetical protein